MAEADAEMVRRVLGGDRSAFETLVSTHLLRARAVARSVLGDDPAVDDVTQEAFMRAYDHLGQLGEPATFPSWLCTIARNEAVTWLRRNARVRAVDLEHAAEQPQVDAQPEDPQLERLRVALSRLSPSYREILALKYEAGLDYTRIGETLGVSVANVEKRLYRARQALMVLMPDLAPLPVTDKPVADKPQADAGPE